MTYAGWVSDSVAGLYQVNVRLPGSNAGPFTSTSSDVISPPLTAPARMPVTVTARGRSSQPGVTIWVTPRLKVTPPSTLMGKAGVPWPSTGNLVTASGGTPSYHYAVTSGVLPPGLALDPVSGAISGTTAAPLGSYLLTITATDSADIPVSDTVTFTLNVQ